MHLEFQMQIQRWPSELQTMIVQAYQQSPYDENGTQPCKICKCMVLDMSLPTDYVTG